MKNNYLTVCTLFFVASQLSADFVINDDLIVDGSACVGFDCVNGEAFGFDTIRLKENNLRIAFDDTSTAASYPRVDWQLTANDSANGGLAKFSIDDISNSRTPFTVEANAPSNSLYIDSTGDAGFGTATPYTDLHTVDGDTPTLRLDQNGSYGWAPQVWDVAGNETNFFIRDVTNGSRLPFRIRPGAPTNSIYIDADGNVGFATASPQEMVHLSKSEAVRIAMTNSSITDDATNDKDWILTSNGRFSINAGGDGTVEVLLDASGNMTLRGSITANGSTFPDYVFDEDYKLMGLAEVEAFTKQNRHLPGIPSAKNVSDLGGHNMTELQLKLLEKVEELTLYSIDQEKRILQQEERIRELEAKLEYVLEKMN